MDQYFHDGEIAVQEQFGTRAAATRLAGANFFDAIPFNHRLFPASQKIAWIGGRDDSGQPWVSAMVHEQGVMLETDGRIMRLRPGALLREVKKGDAVGMLFLEPLSRKRLRINGTVAAIEDAGIVIVIAQCYGNCPKYIVSRKVTEWPVQTEPSYSDTQTALDAKARLLVELADTFFIATATSPDANPRYRSHGVDVSHRGGAPGFIQVVDNTTLQWADFSGNKIFNTLGNISAWPKAAILIPDYHNGLLLEIQGDIEIIETTLDAAEQGRGLQMRIATFRSLSGLLPSQWELV